MNTPPKDQRQPSDRSDNEMPSSPKKNTLTKLWTATLSKDTKRGRAATVSELR